MRNETKLTKATFSKGLAYLTSFYISPTFKDNLNNETIITVWYEWFKPFSDKLFIEMVKLYCERNTYPPNSPNDLLKARREFLLENMSNYNEAWLKVLKKRKELACVRTGNVSIPKLLKEFENDKPTYVAINHLRNELGYIMSSQEEKFIKNDFKVIYNNEMEKLVQNECLLLDVEEIKKLGGGD